MRARASANTTLVSKRKRLNNKCITDDKPEVSKGSLYRKFEDRR